MSTKASSEDSSMEYGKRFLPPIWVDIQEEIERHTEEINNKSIHFMIPKFLVIHNILMNKIKILTRIK